MVHIEQPPLGLLPIVFSPHVGHLLQRTTLSAFAGDRWYPLVKMTSAITVMGEVYVEVLRGIAPSGADQLKVTVVKARDLLPKVCADSL
jgi:hypothetical protein